MVLVRVTAAGLTGLGYTYADAATGKLMNLLAQGVNVSVIALWLGHQRTQSADAYLHADMNIKQAAIDRTRPPNTSPGTYRPGPDILAWLDTL